RARRPAMLLEVPACGNTAARSRELLQNPQRQSFPAAKGQSRCIGKCRGFSSGRNKQNLTTPPDAACLRCPHTKQEDSVEEGGGPPRSWRAAPEARVGAWVRRCPLDPHTTA